MKKNKQIIKKKNEKLTKFWGDRICPLKLYLALIWGFFLGLQTDV